MFFVYFYYNLKYITLIGDIFSGCFDTKIGLSYLTRELAAGIILSAISQRN